MTATTQDAIDKAVNILWECCRMRNVLKPTATYDATTPYMHIRKAWNNVVHSDVYNDWSMVAARDKYALLALAHWLRHCIKQLMQKDVSYSQLLIDIDTAIGIITNETFTFHD